MGTVRVPNNPGHGEREPEKQHESYGKQRNACARAYRLSVQVMGIRLGHVNVGSKAKVWVRAMNNTGK